MVLAALELGGRLPCVQAAAHEVCVRSLAWAMRSSFAGREPASWRSCLECHTCFRHYSCTHLTFVIRGIMLEDSGV